MIQIGKILPWAVSIIKQIGRGGMAWVFAWLGDSRRGKWQWSEDALNRPDSFSAGSRPWRIWTISYRWITDIGEEEEQQYLSVEYVAGLDLKRYIRNITLFK